jgi:hypothetical protein
MEVEQQDKTGSIENTFQSRLSDDIWDCRNAPSALKNVQFTQYGDFQQAATISVGRSTYH